MSGPMSDGMNYRYPTFRMVLQSRGAGRYGFIIGRPDKEEWAKPSLETFASLAEAHEAGHQALEVAARQS